MKRRLSIEPEQRKPLSPLQRKQKYFVDTFQSRNPGSIWNQFLEPVQIRHVDEIFLALMVWLSKPLPPFPFAVLYDIDQKAIQRIQDPKTYALWRFVETLVTTILVEKEFYFCTTWIEHFSHESLVKGSPTTFPTEMMNYKTVHLLLGEFADQCNLFIGFDLFMSYSVCPTNAELHERMSGVRQVWLSHPHYHPTVSAPQINEYLEAIHTKGQTVTCPSEWIVFVLGWYAKPLQSIVLKFARMASFFTKFDLIFDRIWNPIEVDVEIIKSQDLQEANDRRHSKVIHLHSGLSSLLENHIPDRNLHSIISTYLVPPLLRHQIVLKRSNEQISDRIQRILG